MTLLGGLQYGGETAFVDVIDTTADEFKGFQVLRVLPGHLDNEKSMMSASDRTVNYMLIGHLRLEDTNVVPTEKFDQLYDLTDLIVDALDEWDVGNTLNLTDPDLSSWIMSTSRGDWMLETLPGVGAVLTWNIDLQVSYSKDL